MALREERAERRKTQKEAPQNTSALLVGSYYCDTKRETRWVEDGEVHTRPGVPKGEKGFTKCNIKRAYKKVGGKTEMIDETEWVEGDLEIMKGFLSTKKLVADNNIRIYDYREKIGHRYSLGRVDVLRQIESFFQQDKTYFILYYTGHGYSDGSMCFSITTGKKPRGEKRDSANVDQNAGGIEGDGATVEQYAGEIEGGAGLPRGRPRASTLSAQQVAEAIANQPQETDEWNELVRYEEVIQLWDENKKGREQRRLMIILDCCFSGRWVRRVNGEPEDEMAVANVRQRRNLQKRNDISIQAACRPNEKCGVTNSQLCSTFTREFIDALN